ncbi:MAG TPA: mechanosensitive ion channel family protein [Usitatibacter sp.]|nr:mechanosensitive ion channel family protein [Usitatibacter sp.]
MPAGMLRIEMGVAMAGALVLALVLLARLPGDRPSVRNMVLLLGLCALAELASPWTASPALATTAAAVTGLVVIRLAAMFVFRVLLPAARARPARIVEDVAVGALFIAWGFALLRMAGVELTGVIATSAVVTAVLAFSMQETLGNVLGGVVLQLDRSVGAGDWISVDNVSGRVVEIGWRHTAIETRAGETVVLPNSWLMKNHFTVVGARGDVPKPWRRTVMFHVDWSAPPSAVCDALVRSCVEANIATVAASPAPSAILTDATAGFGRYALRYWLTDPRADDGTDSQVRVHALAALQRHGFRLGMPQEERVLIKDNEAHREALRVAEHARRVDALSRVELFAPLTAAERDTLAGHLVYAPFVAGDVMTHQGATAHWLYLVISGAAEVWREGAGGRQLVSVLEPGSVFGEMALMTGEPRRATVVARSDVVCYRLDKAGFETVLQARPDVAEAISRVLSSRETELFAHRAADAQMPAPKGEKDILLRMRRFFALEA